MTWRARGPASSSRSTRPARCLSWPSPSSSPVGAPPRVEGSASALMLAPAFRVPENAPFVPLTHTGCLIQHRIISVFSHHPGKPPTEPSAQDSANGHASIGKATPIHPSARPAIYHRRVVRLGEPAGAGAPQRCHAHLPPLLPPSRCRPRHALSPGPRLLPRLSHLHLSRQCLGARRLLRPLGAPRTYRHRHRHDSGRAGH
jgi:hypothetical protein